MTSCSVLADLVLFCGATCAFADSFDDDLLRVERQDRRKIGRDAFVQGYEKLLADYPRDPRRATVMLRIASQWQNADPRLNMKPNYDKELYWLREARKAAPSRSAEWVEANLRIVGAIYWEEPDACRQILHKVIDAAPGIPAEARAYCWLQTIAHVHKNVEEAEKICMKLQSLIVEWGQLPDEMLGDRGQVYQSVQQSEALMMLTWAEWDEVPVKKRIEKIDEFAERARLQGHIDRDRESALKWLKQRSGDSKSADKYIP